MVKLRLVCLLLLSEVLAFRWFFQKRSYHRTGITISDLVHIQRSTYCQRCSTLHATSVNVKGNSVSNEPGDNTDGLDPQFEEWAEEEIEVQRREVEDLVRTAEKEGTVDELPGYMLRLLEQFDEEGVDDNVPVVASLLPIIAVIGRPNTGKSTIVNRLTNSFKDGAIVHDEPGITRDRTYRSGMWNDYNFQVVDTGGIVFDDVEDIFADKITQQALLALSEATAALMVCDGKEGLNPLDSVLADWLRKKNKVPLYVAVNKCESETQGIAQAQDFWSLGLGQPYPVRYC